jgi:hypothetical protein
MNRTLFLLHRRAGKAIGRFVASDGLTPHSGYHVHQYGVPF